jgi:hypothetical protein
MISADEKSEEPIPIFSRDPAMMSGKLKLIGGSQSDDWNNIIANQTLNALWLKHADNKTQNKQCNAAVAALIGIGPKDEIEGMLAAQLIATHNAAMECYRRAMIGDQTFQGRAENLSQANKLGRTYAVLLDALNRHRGKGQQKVTVEHVHVHKGGQAIVGTVDTAEGGVKKKSQDQPHAKPIAYAPEPTLWGENKERQPLPIASNAERPLPDARRTVTGRSKGK